MKDYTRLHLKLCSGVKTTLHNCEKSPSWELVLKRELFAD